MERYNLIVDHTAGQAAYFPEKARKYHQNADAVIINSLSENKVICKLRYQHNTANEIHHGAAATSENNPSQTQLYSLGCEELEFVRTQSVTKVCATVTIENYPEIWILKPKVCQIIKKTLIARDYYINLKYWLRCEPSSQILSIHVTEVYGHDRDNPIRDNNFVGKANEETVFDITVCESSKEPVTSCPTIGGLDAVINEIKIGMMIDYKIGAFVLIGPSGCGKSTVVEKISYDEKSTLVKVVCKRKNFEDLYEGFSKACSIAQKTSCILFLDRFEQIFNERNNTDSFERDILRFKEAVEKCAEWSSLTVIAATTSLLPLHSLIRRLFYEIAINVPTEQQRKDIVKAYLGSSVSDAVLECLALQTPGFVGEDLRDVCKKIAQLDLLSSSEDHSSFMEKIRSITRNTMPKILRSLEWKIERPSLRPTIGLEEVEKLIKNAIFLPLKYSKAYEQLKLKPSRGIFLYGPPGCGKTSLVSNLAQENGFNFISVKASDVLLSHVGESEKKIAQLFHTARLAQPSIIFIDEIDGLFPARGDGRSRVMLSILSELLQELDGAAVQSKSHQGTSVDTDESELQWDKVIICGATNNPSNIDEALLRPGRMDKHIYIPPPTMEARLQILKMKSVKTPLENSDLLKTIAEETDQWSAATVGNLMDEYRQRICMKDPKYLDPEIFLKNFRKADKKIPTHVLRKYQEFSNKI